MSTTTVRYPNAREAVPDGLDNCSRHDVLPSRASAVTPGECPPIRVRFLTAVGHTSAGTPGPRQLCDACMTTLPVQRVGISVISGEGVHEVLCASDTVADRMEWAQITLGEGPSVDAFASGGPISTVNAAAPDNPWALFTREAAAAGVGPMHALPLQLGAIRIGVLSLYLETGKHWSPEEFDEAVTVSDLVTSVLLASGITHRSNPLNHWWAQQRSSREIHQATGMIVAQGHLSARDAYARLQSYAVAEGLALDDVAAQVLHHRLRFTPDPEVDGPAAP